MKCPICGAKATIRQYAYRDYETGYSDCGVQLDCPRCGLMDEREVEQAMEGGK